MDRRLNSRQRGSATVTVLTMVSFMTIIFIGVAFYVSSIFMMEKRSQDAFEAKKRLIAIARKIYIEIEESETPLINHPFDEFYINANEREDVTLTDISSRLNLNTLHRDMLSSMNNHLLGEGEEETDKLFADPEYPLFTETNNFEQYRKDHGPIAKTKEVYGNYITAEVFDEYFTDYGYFNFNIIDQYVLCQLFDIRRGNDRGDNTEHTARIIAEFYEELTDSDIRKTYGQFMDRAGLRQLFSRDRFYTGNDYDLLFPLLNTEPVMNILFVHPEIIRAILSTDNFSTSKRAPAKLAESVVDWREDEEAYEKGLTIGELKNILNIRTYPDTKILQYFGLITWFWELRVEEDPFELRWIIARKPPEKDMDLVGDYQPEFRLIKEEFGLKGAITDTATDGTVGSGDPDAADDTGEVVDDTGEVETVSPQEKVYND